MGNLSKFDESYPASPSRMEAIVQTWVVVMVASSKMPLNRKLQIQNDLSSQLLTHNVEQITTREASVESQCVSHSTHISLRGRLNFGLLE